MQLSANGLDLEVVVDGPDDGVPLLLISGFGAQLTGWERGFVDLLVSRGARVVRHDNRDTGLSAGCAVETEPSMKDVLRGTAPPPYTLDDMAADAVGVLDALGIESAHICGRSMGGMIAQLVALDFPTRTRSLISVYSTTGARDLPGPEPEVLEAMLAPPPSSHDARIEAGVHWASLVGGTVAFDPERARRRAAEANARAFRPEDARRQYLAILAAPDRTARLQSLDVPALVIHGDADPLVRPEAGRATAAAIPGASYVEVGGMGHDIPPVLWDRVAATISDFVDGVEAARAPGGSAER